MPQKSSPKKAPVSAPDRRVKRTQEKLSRALIALTLAKGYDAVTIRDLTAQADIGYATFFRHYPDKEALLADVLEVVLDELVGFLQMTDGDQDLSGEGVRLFQYVQANSELCRVLVSSRILERLQQTGVRYVLKKHVSRPGSSLPPEVAANHLVASSVALIRWWLENGRPYAPERMGQIYYELIVRPTRLTAFKIKAG